MPRWSIAVDRAVEPFGRRRPDRPIDIREMTPKGHVEGALVAEAVMAVIPPEPVASLGHHERESGSPQTLRPVPGRRGGGPVHLAFTLPSREAGPRGGEQIPRTVLISFSDPGVEACADP